jgi:hypothetical protein
MKPSYILSALIASSLIVSGCSEDNLEGNEAIEKSVTEISGKTTLSKALVCVDSNSDGACTVSDTIQTEADEKGAYTLKNLDGFATGDTLIAQDGYNLISQTNNRHKFFFKTEVQSGAEDHNINMMTSQIVNYKKSENLDSFQAAVTAKAKLFSLSEEMMVKHPIDDDLKNDEAIQALFLKIKSLEEKGSEKNSASLKSLKMFFPFPDGDNSSDTETTDNTESTDSTDLSEEEAEEAVNNTDEDFDFDSYLESISAYIDEMIEYFSNLLFGDESEVVVDESTGNIKANRAALNGTWFLSNAETAEKSCAVVDAQDNLILYTTNSTDELALNFDEALQTMELVYGWTTVDTLTLETFHNDTFTASYSAGIVESTKMTTLTTCKTKL